jgi:hypothetical protein
MNETTANKAVGRRASWRTSADRWTSCTQCSPAFRSSRPDVRLVSEESRGRPGTGQDDRHPGGAPSRAERNVESRHHLGVLVRRDQPRDLLHAGLSAWPEVLSVTRRS